MKKIIEDWFYKKSAFKYYQTYDSISGTKVIDVLGPPAIGKSTYIDYLMKNKILKKPSSKISFEKNSKSNAHALLLAATCSQTDDLKTLKRKANKLHFDLNVLNSKNTYFIDEGISHQFTQPLIDLAHNKPDEFRKICHKRAAINLTAPAEVINERIKTRFLNSRKMLRYHQEKEEEELIKWNLKLLEKRNELAIIYSQFDVPILQLDTTNPWTDLKEKTKQFLIDLKKKEI